ncbi:hypothetical protein HC928_15880, partial [bacterium]|nr:hypothetical protein [bacterium]
QFYAATPPRSLTAIIFSLGKILSARSPDLGNVPKGGTNLDLLLPATRLAVI